MMNANTFQARDNASSEAAQPYAGIGLAIIRLTIGCMFVSVFFENRGKGLYTPAVYAGLIDQYIQQGHSPAVWKSFMGLAASHASLAAPLQGLTEISLGVLLLLGLFTRPAGLVAFGWLGSLWISELGIGWIWELLPPTLACLALSVGSAGRTWGLDSLLARRNPSSLFW
ncbi:MAG: TQO small subunit DoxD [Candidatus Acidiferrales bacterium]